MHKNITSILFFVLTCFVLNAQNITDQNEKLQILLDKLKAENLEKQTRVSQYLNSKSILEKEKLQSLFKKGYHLEDIVNGKPSFIKSFNRDAGTAMGVPEVRSGGSLGLNLEGEDMNIGIWDGGLIRTTHREFEGRISYFDAAATTVFSDHATGVAGTLLGSGIEDHLKGMAPKATGIAYNFINDEAEMVEAQMIRTILVSNHSYGLIAGWDDGQWWGDTGISDQEDWRFGFYTGGARNWDEIAYNAPQYLIVKSAGNDRGDSGSGPFPSDGPYDCVAGESTAKNIMLVGAVQKSFTGYDDPSNILMSSFSGWGPTDDGRIKPDLVGIGVSVATAAADDDQDTQVTNGTSFSSPAVCGGLALIQELHQEKYNRYLNSSTLKALAIHTVKQTGAVGPDYRFGWGLMNVEGTAEFLLNEDGINNRVIEDQLTDGEVMEYDIRPQAGTDVRITLAWLDPPGTVPPTSLDPDNPILVNDLDIRLVDEVGNAFEPYILDPANPQSSATTGDNFRDNVEQIFVEGIEERDFTIRLNHKGNLSTPSQNYSLIVEYLSADNQLTNMYWINNSGSWDDAQHWSLSSGGTASGQVPGEANRVIIDDNSISGQNDVLTLPTDFNVGSISVFVSKPFTLDLNGNKLQSSGNIKINSSLVTVANGSLQASNTDNTFAGSINIDLTNMATTDLVLPSANRANWSIANSELNVKNIDVVSGGLDLNNCSGNLNSILSGPADDTLFNAISIVSSQLNIAEDFIVDGLSEFESDGNDFTFSGDMFGEARVGSYDLGSDVLILNKPEFLIAAGDAVVNQLTVDNSWFVLTGNISCSHLTVNGASEVEMIGNNTINVKTAFEINNGTEIAKLNGSDVGISKLNLEFHEKLCFDYLDILNLNLTGASSVSIGSNSTLVNSMGWSELPCNQLLFANYTAEYPCVSAQTEFTDASEGNPTSWEWFINGNLVSTNNSFTYSFQSTGIKEIEMLIGDNIGNTSRYNSTIEIMDTPLDSNMVIVSTSTILASQRSADAYQWYANDEKLDGETSRTYLYNGVLADYFVMTFEDGCNRKSKVLKLLTSVDEPEPDGSKFSVILAPNPVSENLRVEFTDVRYESIQLLDAHGKSIFDHKNTNQDHLIIPMSDYAPGLYIIALQTEVETQYFKVIKI